MIFMSWNAKVGFDVYTCVDAFIALLHVLVDAVDMFVYAHRC